MTDHPRASGGAGAGGMDCARCAALLPLLGTDALDEAERDLVRAHLARCASCRAESASYELATVALGRYVAWLAEESAAPSASLSAADIAALAHSAAPQRAAHGAPRRGPSAERRGTPSSPVASRFAALAAVLVVALLAGAIFATHGARTGYPAGPATATAAGATGEQTVYALGAHGDRLYALRGADGGVLGTYDAPRGPDRGQITSAGVSYWISDTDLSGILSSQTQLEAVRLRDGKVLWRRMIDNIWSPYLTVAGGTLYLSSDPAAGQAIPANIDSTIHAVYAFRVTDGAALWRHALPDVVCSPPVVAGGVVYAATATQVFALRTDDGAPLWTVPLDTGGQDAIRAWPTVADGALYLHVSVVTASPPAGSGEKAHFGVETLALRTSDGLELWKRALGGDIFPDFGPFAPVAADGIVYDHATYDDFGGLVHLQMVALRASDGAVLWHYADTLPADTSRGIPNLHGPTVADGVVYVSEDGGYLTALRAGDGTMIWRTRIQTPLQGTSTFPYSISAPTAAKGRLFLAVDGELVAVRASDGGVLWRQALIGAPGTQALVVEP